MLPRSAIATGSFSCLGFSLLLGFSSATSAGVMSSIADSYHNLGATNSRTTTPNGGTPPNHSNDTAEICVFCHTPHGVTTQPLCQSGTAN